MFQVDLYILPLAGCDVVLGTQWLRILGPILWNFVSLTMEFQYSKTKCVLQGLQQVPQVSLEDANAFKLSNKRNKGVLLQLMESEDNTTIEAQKEDQQLEVQGPFNRISGYFP